MSRNRSSKGKRGGQRDTSAPSHGHMDSTHYHYARPRAMHPKGQQIVALTAGEIGGTAPPTLMRNTEVLSVTVPFWGLKPDEWGVG